MPIVSNGSFMVVQIKRFYLFISHKIKIHKRLTNVGALCNLKDIEEVGNYVLKMLI